MQHFDQSILSIIKKFAYPIYLINVNPLIDCTCVNTTSKQPEPACLICLGTGSKINIRLARGVSQNATMVFSTAQFNVKNQSTVMPIYYLEQQYPVQTRDLIVDKEEVWVAQKVDGKKSENRQIVYYRAETAPKKGHELLFLANFYSIVGR